MMILCQTSTQELMSTMAVVVSVLDRASWVVILTNIPDSKVHGDMGLIWGRQDPGGPHVGPMNLAIWDGEAVTFTDLLIFYQPILLILYMYKSW